MSENPIPAAELPVLLIVEDDEGLQRQLKWAYEGYRVISATDRAQAIEMVRLHEPAVVTLDLGLPPDPDGTSEGFATLTEILELKPDAKIIVASGHGARESALKAIALGAYDFYRKPVDIDELGLIVSRAFHLQEIEAENRRLEAAGGSATAMGALLTASPEMVKVIRTIDRIANADVSVMLLGASGTGKELLARAVHEKSPRGKGEFVAINCAAIPENLLEAELFGYERGAFTGAVKTTPGKIELAQGGTLFLDEVGDIPLPLQVKLLRFLQERVIERIGGRSPIAVDTRIVCATHQDLGCDDRRGPLPRRPLLSACRDRGENPEPRRTGRRRGASGPPFRRPLRTGNERQGANPFARCRRCHRRLSLAGQCPRARKPHQAGSDHGRRQERHGRRPRSSWSEGQRGSSRCRSISARHGRSPTAAQSGKP